MRVIKRLSLLILVSLFSMLSNAQSSNPFVKNFTAEAIDGKLFITWTTRAGFTCQDIHIEVSKDSMEGFERRGTYFGICGDASEKDYSYILENPNRNSLNYLRLELGNYGHSNVISIQVISAVNEVLITPNPATPNTTIHFENRVNETVQIDFFSSTGQLIHSATTRDNKIQLAGIPLPKGIVYYHLIGDGILTFRGKFIVESSF